MEFEYTKRYTVFDEPLPLTDLKTDNFYATNSIGIAGTSSNYELYVNGDTNIVGVLSASDVTIDNVNASTAGIGTGNATGIGSTSTVFGVLGDTTVTGYQYRGSRIKTASLTVRGGGLNQSNGNDRFVALNGEILYDGSGRGLALTIIGVGLTHVSTANYDVFGDTVASDNLAAAISGISTGQIGVLSSADAWELSVTDNLRTAARRVGLSKLGNFYYPGGGSYRRPYAAVFSGIGTNLNSSPHDVIERMESRDSNALYASIFCTIASDEVGVSIHGATSTNVLYSADSDIEEPVLLVDSNSNVGIGTSIPTNKLDVIGNSYISGSVTCGNVNPTSTIVPTHGYYRPNGVVSGFAHGFTINGAETLRLNENSYLQVNTTANGGGGTNVWSRFVATEVDSNVGSVKAVNTNASVTTQGLVRIEQVASANITSFLIYGGSGAVFPSTIDSEFYVRSDGNAFADGTWAGGGADYAEMFEWLDGNPDNEDRRGITVVLETNKIRPAEVGEDPIGVISANPVVLGDSGDAKWHEKHLRDDFGSYIWEPHEVIEWTGENGKLYSYESHNIPENIVIPEDHIVKTEDDKGNPFKHRKINPLWDPNLEYIPRENRPEWSPVGLMGKLRIRKNQPTGSRWIKMRDVSEQVEEWLVR